jgi:hypothetical protein
MTGERFQGMLRRLEGSDHQRVAAYAAAWPAAAAGR